MYRLVAPRFGCLGSRNTVRTRCIVAKPPNRCFSSDSVVVDDNEDVSETSSGTAIDADSEDLDTNIKIHVAEAGEIEYKPLRVLGQPKVPTLEHNLDRVLFSPGVHFLKDPRTHVYNFTPYLDRLMSIKDFDFNLISQFVPPDKDNTLSRLTRDKGLKYFSSTSSITGILSHFHFALSHMRPPVTVGLPLHYPGPTTKFSKTLKRPVSVFLRHNHENRVFSITSDKSTDETIILSLLGHTLETLLTTPEKTFKFFSKKKSGQLDSRIKNRIKLGSAYNYSSCGNILLRSQLDCYDPRLPGTGMFDLKTRAVCAVRHDLDYVQVLDGSNYEVTKLNGNFHSFSREWYELIKTALLKYSFQARIGRMDGIFVAYHNIRRMFGFQYVSLDEMDSIFHSAVEAAGSRDARPSYLPTPQPLGLKSASFTADAEFKMSLDILQKALDQITAGHDGHTDYNIVFHASRPGCINIFVKPMDPSHVSLMQQQCSDIDSEPTTGDDSRYAYGKDPHTIWRHAEEQGSDIRWIPPDVTGYTLTMKSFINSKIVPNAVFPTIQNPTDNWTVKWQLEELPKRLAREKFANTFASKPRVLRELITEPQTERLGSKKLEKERITSQMQALQAPSKFQEILRKVSRQRPAHPLNDGRKEPVVMWIPKELLANNKPQNPNNVLEGTNSTGVERKGANSRNSERHSMEQYLDTLFKRFEWAEKTSATINKKQSETGRQRAANSSKEQEQKDNLAN
uniref:ARAD1C12584p n=1 Tax=Blastobotrys adeninivorans TaxID=409370 RepID=A0A060T5I7_BLAAD